MKRYSEFWKNVDIVVYSFILFNLTLFYDLSQNQHEVGWQKDELRNFTKNVVNGVFIIFVKSTIRDFPEKTRLSSQIW